jgi:hypothetical protein
MPRRTTQVSPSSVASIFRLAKHRRANSCNPLNRRHNPDWRREPSGSRRGEAGRARTPQFARSVLTVGPRRPRGHGRHGAPASPSFGHGRLSQAPERTVDTSLASSSSADSEERLRPCKPNCDVRARYEGRRGRLLLKRRVGEFQHLHRFGERVRVKPTPAPL